MDKVDKILEKLSSIDNRISSMDERFDSMDNKINSVDGKLNSMEKALRTEIKKVSDKQDAMIINQNMFWQALNEIRENHENRIVELEKKVI